MTLHVTNGDSAGDTLLETGLDGDVLSWRDTLHEGPVPDVPRPELLRSRAAFLAGCGWGDPDELFAELERRDRQLLEADEVVLWFEHDVYDQLQLIDVLALLPAPPQLIVVDTYLGELSASELAALWPSRTRGTPAQLQTAAGAWAAVRAPEPTALVEWATRDLPELPFLAPALRRLLEMLPAPSDGLSRTERQALQVIAAGADTPMAAFVAAQELEEAKFLGDSWFFLALEGLGPLLEQAPLRLTATGEKVLRGDADRVELLGIDRWVGGTHVTPQNLWRWDAAALRLTAP